MREFEIGEIIEGTITDIRSFGVLMIFEDDRLGLLHISEISTVYIRNLKRFMTRGKTYQVKVIDIAEDGFLRVSMKQISDVDKEEFKTKKENKVTINPEITDFTPLKELLEKEIGE